MKCSHLIFAALLGFAIACTPSAQVPGGDKPKNYPLIIQASEARQALAQREWQRLLEAYNVKAVEADLYPVIVTPRSLTHVQGGLKITTIAIQPGTEEVTIREAARKFIERWRDLLGLTPAGMSLVSAQHLGDAHRLNYKQADYPFPLAGTFGTMTLSLSNDGRLLQLDDRFIPVVDLPIKPVIDRQAVILRVANRTFTYSNVAGQPQSLKIAASDISVQGLVVYPVEKNDKIEVHLAWEIAAGKSLAWNVYIDAINGEDIAAVQKFNT
ncbi:MAG: hypothetical protein HY231_06615 [Acidobacteria bacterium]|nr:hypothetical protein [Acidobacteriota bacterium]